MTEEWTSGNGFSESTNPPPLAGGTVPRETHRSSWIYTTLSTMTTISCVCAFVLEGRLWSISAGCCSRMETPEPSARERRSSACHPQPPPQWTRSQNSPQMPSLSPPRCQCQRVNLSQISFQNLTQMNRLTRCKSRLHHPSRCECTELNTPD